jgi:hypothetical protein
MYGLSLQGKLSVVTREAFRDMGHWIIPTADDDTM